MRPGEATEGITTSTSKPTQGVAGPFGPARSRGPAEAGHYDGASDSGLQIAVPRGTPVPRLSTPPLRVINISPAVFELGIEEHRVEGQTVGVYSIARTIADCFRFRNKIGLDVALEALRDSWRSKRLKLDELNRIARKLRVQRVMQPYVETVVM